MSDVISTRIISSANAACSYMFQAGRAWQRLDKDCEETYRLAAQEAFYRMCADLELLKNKEKISE